MLEGLSHEWRLGACGFIAWVELFLRVSRVVCCGYADL